MIVMGLMLAAGTALAQDEEGEATEDAAAEEEAAPEEGGMEEEMADEGGEAEAEASAEGEAGVEADLGVRKSVGYGPAGCGLGSMIFEPDSGFTQIFAATTNGSTYTQTFGITSGTSNCDDTGGGAESAKAFVQTNRAALAKDMARGQGETISSLSALAGCSNTAAVGTTLQSNFDVVFPSASVSDEQVSSTVIDVLKSNETLGCGDLA